MRRVPVMVEIATDVRALAPEALFSTIRTL
jgi:alpha-galactosidase/6-phospho-beta-glucosidase family protein